jgi:hypothetical protein
VFERWSRALRAICVGLVCVVLVQVVQLAAHKDPLAGVVIPRQSGTAAPRNSADGATNSAGGGNSAATAKPAPLPLAVEARVERIAASELLGPVPRPMSNPAALIGIAGQDAMIRASDGQVGLLRRGEEFHGIKLLQVGTNRVVIEESGHEKELTMFSGFGSESLLPRGKEKVP